MKDTISIPENTQMPDLLYYMQCAINQARRAGKKGEVPVGAVIVKDDRILSVGINMREKNRSATAHAEMMAIEKACKKLRSWRLEDCDLYVTLEPCPMCAGAILQARMKNVYFGAYDQKAGAAGSVFNLFADYTFNHEVNIQGGVLEEDCQSLLSDFFSDLRKKKQEQKSKRS